MMQALEVDYVNGRVRYLPDQEPEPWLDVLERTGDEIHGGAFAVLSRVPEYSDDEGRTLHRVYTEWSADGGIPVKVTDYYLVGPKAGPSERDYTDDEIKGVGCVPDWEGDR